MDAYLCISALLFVVTGLGILFDVFKDPYGLTPYGVMFFFTLGLALTILGGWGGVLFFQSIT